MQDLSYFQLRAHLYPKEQNLQVPFTLQELENVWFCSKKNVKRKLKRYEEQGKLVYTPGSGRGNPSHLQFHEPFQKEVESYVHHCAERDELDKIVQLFQLSIPKTWISNVSEQVRELFGLQSSRGEQDTLRTGIARKLATLDPLYCSVTFENHLIDQLSDTLVTYDEQKDEIGPHLAHHWNVDKENKVWTFYLRKGVKFHHHKTLTSEDVQHSFNRILKQDSPMKWMVQGIDTINCPSPFKVVITLRESNPFFIRYVSSVNLAILPSDIPFDEKEWIGTGPFELKEMDENKFVLEAFDYYFLERPLLDRIEFWRVPMGAAEAMSFRIGEQSHSFEDQYEELETGFRFLIFNFRRSSPVHDPFLREALYHILDMKKMWRDLGVDPSKKGKLASSFHPWRSDEVVKDSTRILDALEQSSYNGEVLHLHSLDFQNAIEEAEWLQEQAAHYGIQMQIHTFSLDELYSDKLLHNADLALMGEVATTDIYLSFLGAFYNNALIFRKLLSEEHLNYIDEKLERFKHAETNDQQVTIMEEVESFLRDYNLIIFQFHPLKKRTFDPMIRDIRFQSFGYVDFKKLWIP